MTLNRLLFTGSILIFFSFTSNPSKTTLESKIENLSVQIESKMVEWRHHLHEHPELSNREYKTAEYIANHLEDLGLDEPGLNRVIRAGYHLLNLQTYFTAGVKEVRAWTVAIGATAPKAAAVIHTDFEKDKDAEQPNR